VRRLACSVLVAAVACTGPTPGGPSGPGSGSTAAAPDLFVRTCESSVSGALGVGWRRGEAAAGPVVFVAASGYANDPPRRFSVPGDRASLHKVLIVVMGDAAVEVSVDHPDAALAYDPAKWGLRNRMRLEAGDARVRFDPCPDRRTTQFNGGFLVRGPVCVPVQVWVEGELPASSTLSFGAGACG
jgi:hypothetical protein